MKNEYVLISYDIENDRSRDKVCNILLDAGAVRVQKSVFECLVSKAELKSLQAQLKKFRKKTDSIRYYPLCQSCLKKIKRDEDNPEMGLYDKTQIMSI